MKRTLVCLGDARHARTLGFEKLLDKEAGTDNPKPLLLSIVLGLCLTEAIVKTALVVLFLALLKVNLSPQSSVPPAQLFDYDANAALGILESSKKVIEGITVYDLSYSGPKGRRVTSYLGS